LNLFIVIPVHNRIGFTRECLLSLKKQTIGSFRIVVIDDGSTDGTSEMIRSEFPDVVLLSGDGNLWFTAATNLGVEYALAHLADQVMILNNDTFSSPDFIEKMVDWAEKEPQALLGAFALDCNTKKPVYGGERINWKTAGSTMLLDILEPEEQIGLHEVTHFPTRGLLIPSEVFRRIGLLDAKRFPHYASDYDFTHHAIRAGYQVFCNYDAKLYIRPDASGSQQLIAQKNLKNYFDHLFGIKGGGNLKIFTLYVLNNCPIIYRPWFLLRGYIQRILGYWQEMN
jgi:GT2 family glycosyltransferase